MWSALSTRQRNLLIGLAVANLFLLTAMGALLLAPEPQPIAIMTPPALDTRIVCRSAAARALADRDVAGTVAIRADGSIDFAVSSDDPADAWDAFAASAELPAQDCGPYDPIRIDVPDPSLTPNLRLVVEARWADVKAWSLGQIDDEALSSRTIRSIYVIGSLPARP
ncbi:MAG: hypothetical protein ACRDGG_08420 [Anaerolineae bacterium]